MDFMQQGVVTLLKSSITGEKLPLPEGFDLEAAYPKLKAHHMDAMLYAGALNCGISRSLPVMKSLFQRYCKALMVSEGQMEDLERLFTAFDENGIDYMPLKGSKMKALYPQPELRIMGDADILIRVEQYEAIVPVMEALGFQFQGESDHELKWQSGKLFVELHKHLIPSYNKDYFEYFGSGWQMARPQSGSRYSMSTEDEWIFLFTHFAKHFRDGGIGCRYVVDLWVYLRSYPEMDREYLKKTLKTLQLAEFHDHICTLIFHWFEDGEADRATGVISDYIFSSGSWGGTESKVVSRALRDSKKPSGVRGRLVYLWQTAFPGVMVLQDKYTVLQKAPWMLPLVWMYRPFYKVLFERRDLKKKKRVLDALSTQNLSSRQEFLNEIGLDYRF